MLNMMKDGKVFAVSKVGHASEYVMMKARTSHSDFSLVWNFLESDINEDEFSLRYKIFFI